MRPRVARYLRGDLDGLGEVTGDVGEGRQEKVAEAVAIEVALMEAVLEQAGRADAHLRRQRHHAVAHVAGGQHLEVFAQAAGGASVIGDSDDCGKIADEARMEEVSVVVASRWFRGAGRCARWSGPRPRRDCRRGNVALEATQKRG